MQIRLSCVTQKHLQKVCKRATLFILVWNAGVGNTQEAFVQQDWVSACMEEAVRPPAGRSTILPEVPSC